MPTERKEAAIVATNRRDSAADVADLTSRSKELQERSKRLQAESEAANAELTGILDRTKPASSDREPEPDDRQDA
jgi:hypothetical protein